MTHGPGRLTRLGLTLAAAAFPLACLADTLKLKDGRTLTGEAHEEGDQVAIVLKYGTIRVPRSDVVNWDKSPAAPAAPAPAPAPLKPAAPKPASPAAPTPTPTPAPETPGELTPPTAATPATPRPANASKPPLDAAAREQMRQAAAEAQKRAAFDRARFAKRNKAFATLQKDDATRLNKAWTDAFKKGLDENLSRAGLNQALLRIDALWGEGDEPSFNVDQAVTMANRIGTLSPPGVEKWKTALGIEPTGGLTANAATAVTLAQQDKLFDNDAYNITASESMLVRIPLIPPRALAAWMAATGSDKPTAVLTLLGREGVWNEDNEFQDEGFGTALAEAKERQAEKLREQQEKEKQEREAERERRRNKG